MTDQHFGKQALAKSFSAPAGAESAARTHGRWTEPPGLGRPVPAKRPVLLAAGFPSMGLCQAGVLPSLPAGAARLFFGLATLRTRARSSFDGKGGKSRRRNAMP